MISANCKRRQLQRLTSIKVKLNINLLGEQWRFVRVCNPPPPFFFLQLKVSSYPPFFSPTVLESCLLTFSSWRWMLGGKAGVQGGQGNELSGADGVLALNCSRVLSWTTSVGFEAHAPDELHLLRVQSSLGMYVLDSFWRKPSCCFWHGSNVLQRRMWAERSRPLRDSFEPHVVVAASGKWTRLNPLWSKTAEILVRSIYGGWDAISCSSL